MSTMSSIFTAVSRGLGFRASENWPGRYTIDDIASLFKFGDLLPNTTMQAFREHVSGDFPGLVEAAYRGNAIVFACELVRFSLFSEIRFQFQQMRGGRPGDLFGTPDLGILETPEPGKTTGDLMNRALLHADFAGSAYVVRRRRDRVKLLRPDWTAILLGSPNPAVDLPAHDPDIEVIGYAYWPGGMWSGVNPITFDASEVAHFAPVPDPIASYRGMSWLTPLIRELKADSAATQHKLEFFSNAATPNAVVKFPAGMDEKTVRTLIEIFEQEHTGVVNAYRTAYLAGGADMTVVGAHLKEMDFKSTQGAGETRIAIAAGLHASIVGMSEGLAGSALNSGNLNELKQLMGDKTLRFLWRNMAGSLQTIVPPPSGSRLWYDVRDVAFLAQDVKEAAEVMNIEMTAIGRAITNGFEPDGAVDAVTSGDLRRLSGRHSGFLSVQMQPFKPEDFDDEQEAAAAELTMPSFAARASTPQPADPSGPYVVASLAFSPSSGMAAGRIIDEGALLPASDAAVRAFPQFFRAASPEQVLAVSPVRALLGAGYEHEIRCTGKRKDGSPCGALIVKATSPGPLGIEGKCERCGTLVAA